MSKIWDLIKGKKTYAATLLWVIYKIAVLSGKFPAHPELEVVLLGAGAAAFRDALNNKKPA